MTQNFSIGAACRSARKKKGKTKVQLLVTVNIDMTTVSQQFIWGKSNLPPHTQIRQHLLVRVCLTDELLLWYLGRGSNQANLAPANCDIN